LLDLLNQITGAPAGSPHALDTGLAWERYPVSPDGASLIVWGMRRSGDAKVEEWWTVPAAGGQAIRVGARDTVRPLRIRYFPAVLDWYASADGPQVLFAPDAGDYSNLWRMGVRPGGEPPTLPVRVTNGPGRQVRASFARTKDGLSRLAFSDETLNYDVWRLAVNPTSGLAGGNLERVTDRLTPEMNPSISGDGRQIYYITARLGTYSLVGRDMETNRERTIYSAPRLLYNARVAPQGRKVYFSNGSADLLAIPSGGGAVEQLCPRCGSVTGVSHDGGRVTYQPVENEDLLVFDVASRKTIKLADRGASELIDLGQTSPDGKWMAFETTNNATQESAIYVIPIAGQLPVPRDQWIRVTDVAELGRDPVWAPQGPFLYFTSERDGFRCLWARRLDPASRRPQGTAIAVQHFHAARLGLRRRASSGNIISLSAGGSHLVFALTEMKGSIWLEDAKSAR
jgi:tricorn protease-like protein